MEICNLSGKIQNRNYVASITGTTPVEMSVSSMCPIQACLIPTTQDPHEIGASFCIANCHTLSATVRIFRHNSAIYAYREKCNISKAMMRFPLQIISVTHDANHSRLAQNWMIGGLLSLDIAFELGAGSGA